MRHAISMLFTQGLQAYRKDVLEKASRRTWFRYQEQLKRISDGIQLPRDAMAQFSNAELLEYLMSQFGIKSKLREARQQGLF
jgi:hypothetical protein